MASEWWTRVVAEFARERKTGQVTLNFKDGLVASVDVRDHRTPPRDGMVRSRIYVPSACGVIVLDKRDKAH